MSGKASTSKPNIGLSGSDGLSHAYIQYPPLRCNVPGSRGLFYDDGNKLLLSPTADQVFSWKVSPFDPLIGPNTDSISEGPIIAIRYSLDTKVIAIQRSNHEIQFWDKETGESFSHKCRPESESILGFFWTDSQQCDIVLVKTSGLDLYAYNSQSKSLQLVETKKLTVSWYVYTHESRLVLLASGMQCKTFHGFQISSADIVRLPRFEMVMAKSEANSKPVLAAEDTFIVTVYGRIYCLQVDRVAMLLHSYRLYRDAVIQQGSLPIYSSRIAVSVVDNVLLIHQVDAKVVILYDLFADSRAPISAPLPLLLRGFPRSGTSSQSSGRESESSDGNVVSNHEAVTYADTWTFLVPDLVCNVANKILWKFNLDLDAISASNSEVPSVLEFLQRRKLEASKAKQLCLGITRTLILEHRPLSVVAKAINVLVTSYSHSIKTGNYLKGLKPEKTSVSGVQNAGADVSTIEKDATGKSIIHESTTRVDSGSFNKASTVSSLDSEDESQSANPKHSSKEARVGGKVNNENLPITEAHSAYDMQSSLQSGQEESQLTSAAISPDEMYSFVFSPVDEEMVGDPSYLVAIIIEFLHSANLEKIRVLPNLYVLIIQLLARNERYAELGLYVTNKILEPSKEVALQLLESGRQNTQTRKLGLDMLRQLGLHHDYVLLLVQDGYYLEALRYARKYKMDLNQFNPDFLMNWMQNSQPTSDHNPEDSSTPPNPQSNPNMRNFPMFPLPDFFHPHLTNMQNPFMGQYGLNFQPPQPSPATCNGSSRGTIGEEGQDEHAQIPVVSILESILESEVPPVSFEDGLENIVINEEQRLGSRTKSRVRFRMEEDTLLIQSWLNVSKDAIVGVDQKVDSFWRRISYHYNEHRSQYQERGPIALKSRWQKLNSAVQKFVGCYKQAVRAKKSGSTENDVVNDALAIFSQDDGEAFRLEYAWRLLKDNPKWNSYLRQGPLKRTKVSASGEYTSSSASDGEEGQDEHAQIPVVSILESEVPPVSFEAGLENIVINEEQRLGSRTKSRVRFRMEEDTLLIQSWLNVSKNAIVGVDQKADSFWQRISHHYNEHRGQYQERGPIALKSRWQKLNSAVQKFVGCYKQAVRAKKSGSTENDVVNDALAIFSQDDGEAFKLEYAWRLLKDNPKWNSYLRQGPLKRTKVSASGEYTSSSTSDVPTREVEEDSTSSPMLRPIGTKMAKRKAKAKSQETSSIAAEFKTLQESHKERIAEMTKLRCLKEAQIKMKEREIEIKEWEILLKDTSGMNQEQLASHTKICKIIKERRGLS